MKNTLLEEQAAKLAEVTTAATEMSASIQEDIGESHKAVSEITAAINQQARVSDSIATSVDTVNGIARQTESAAAQIVVQSNQLQSVIQSSIAQSCSAEFT